MIVGDIAFLPLPLAQLIPKRGLQMFKYSALA